MDGCDTASYLPEGRGHKVMTWMLSVFVCSSQSVTQISFCKGECNNKLAD